MTTKTMTLQEKRREWSRAYRERKRLATQGAEHPTTERAASEKAETRAVKLITKKCALCDRPFRAKKIEGKWAKLERSLCSRCYGYRGF